MNDVKKETRSRARLLRGLTNVLQLDAEYIWDDSNRYDPICLTESIAEAKSTVQQITDCVIELEYLLYLAKKEES